MMVALKVDEFRHPEGLGSASVFPRTLDRHRLTLRICDTSDTGDGIKFMNSI